MSKTIQTIGILAHPRRPESAQVARTVQQHTQQRGLTTWIKEIWTEADIQESLPTTDMIVAIGGDGAMLQAGRLCAPYQVPVFGLNMGYLGFLAEATPDEWDGCLERLIAGDYWIESRLMIRGEVWRENRQLSQGDALNDIVVSRNSAAKTIHLEAYIDDGWVTNYNADGLIIATATGSTAYALAAGGPILPPELDNIMLVPIAAHLSMDRSVVLSQGASLTIIVSAQTRTEPSLTIDGQNPIALQIGDEVRVKAGPHRSLFTRLQGRNYFFRSLMDRMEPRFLPKHPPKPNIRGL
jgi:NAD+ kinase